MKRDILPALLLWLCFAFPALLLLFILLLKCWETIKGVL